MNRKPRTRYGTTLIARDRHGSDRLVWANIETPPLPRRLFTEIISFPVPPDPGPPPHQRRPLAA